MCSKSMAIQSMSILRITGVCACETGESFYSVSKNEKNTILKPVACIYYLQPI